MTEKEDVKIGENVTTFESLGYFLLSMAFVMFYLGTLSLNLNLYIFISILLATICFKVAWERAARNRERNLKAGPGYSERIIKPIKFEILLVSPAFEKIVGPFIENLKRLGIKVALRIVDPAQYKNRLDQFDYDMVVIAIGQSLSPGNEQKNY